MLRTNFSKSDAMRAVLNMAIEWRKSLRLGDINPDELAKLNKLIKDAENKPLGYREMLFGEDA